MRKPLLRQQHPGWRGQSCGRETGMTLRYVWKDNVTHKRGLVIGIASVFLVVMFLSLLLNALDQSDMIFFRLAENGVGEMDVVMTPDPDQSQSLLLTLNETFINEKSLPLDSVHGSTARWLLPGTILNRDHPQRNLSVLLFPMNTRHEESLGIGRAWPYRVLGEEEAHVTSTALSAVGLQPQLGERALLEINLSEYLKSQNLDSSTSLFSRAFTDSLLTSNGVSLDQNITFTPNITELFPPGFLPPNVVINARVDPITVTGAQLSEIIQTALHVALTTPIEVTIVDSISDTFARYPGALGNVAILDSTFLLRVFRRNLQAALSSGLGASLLDAQGVSTNALSDSLMSLRLEDFAFTTVVMWEDRLRGYLSDNADDDLISLSNDVALQVGYDFPATYTFPVSLAMQGVQFFSLFMFQLVLGVFLLLVVLGVMVIYSFLLGKTEEKTYEYGMLRALGLRTRSLILLLSEQSLLLSIPGVILGIAASSVISIFINRIFADFAVLPPNQWLTAPSIYIPVIVGIVMPLVSNYFPIQRALSKTLRDSLDVYHQTFNETTVRMMKLAEMGLRPWQAILAFFLVAAGFVVYYVIPWTFTYFEFTIFFTILNLVLLGMILGLCMIALTLQPKLEILLLKGLLWGPDARMQTLIRKNLASHRSRSRKTAFMFIIAIGFIVFEGSVFTLMAGSVGQQTRWFNGADLVVRASLFDQPLPHERLAELASGMKATGQIHDFAFATFPLTSSRFIDRTYLSSLAGFPRVRTNVIAVDQNFLEVTLSDFYTTTEVQSGVSFNRTSSGKVDLVDSLYSTADKGVYAPPRFVTGFSQSVDVEELNAELSREYHNMHWVLLSEATRDGAGVDTSRPLLLQTTAHNSDRTKYVESFSLSRARGMASKMPGFLGFTSFFLGSLFSQTLVSMEVYRSMLGTIIDRLPEETGEDALTREEQKEDLFRMQAMFIKMPSGSGEAEKSHVSRVLLNVLDSQFSGISNTEAAVRGTEETTNYVVVFYNIVAVVAVLLCFFMLWISFTANVQENSWEFGVIRSIGLTVNKVIRAYIYEALVMILASTLFGSIIGFLAGLSLTAQFNLFLDLPFTFAFPYALFFSVFGMSILVAILGSYLPARTLKGKQIAHVIKGL